MSLENFLNDFRNVEETKIRKQIAALPRNGIYDYFDEVDAVLKDLKNRRQELEAEEGIRIENLKDAKGFLVSIRKELKSLKQQVLQAVASHEKQRLEAVKYVQTKAPDLVDHVEKLSEMKNRLYELKFAHPFEMELQNIKAALTSQDYEFLLSRYESAILETSSIPASLVKECEKKVDLLDDFLLDSLKKDLYKVYEKIRFPFEFSIDFRIVRSDLEASIHILNCIQTISNRKRVTSVNEVLSLVTRLFAERFDFHFCGSSRTNNPAKPEWFFKQTLDWISYNGDYFSTYLQRICDLFGCQETADELFVRGLVSTVKDKTKSLLSTKSFMSNRIMFSHLLDEAITFSNEINQVCENASGLPDVMSLFMEPGVIDEWIELEKDAISAGIDEILSDPDAYKCRFEEARDIDRFIVPNFANTFIILMRSMSERYMVITVSSPRYRFLKHQLLIMDEFLSRIARIFHEVESPWHSPYPALMNAVWFIGIVLEEWNVEDKFIELSGTERKQSLTRGPFDESADLYRHEWRKRAKHLIISFRSIINSRVKIYAAQNWFQMSHSKPSDFSPSLSSFVDEINARIIWLRKNISEDSRLALFRLINFEIWDCLMTEVVSSNSFTHKAAAQMLFDFQNGLIPLLNKSFVPSKTCLDQDSGFKHFDVSKEKRCSEVLNVLRVIALPSPTAILLRDEIHRIPESMVPDKTAPFGITGFNREQLLLLFEQRCDMHRID